MNWDQFFHSLCDAYAKKSPCLSRQIGAILVRDKRVIASGYNGPPEGVPHCGRERLESDIRLSREFVEKNVNEDTISHIYHRCPRRLLRIESGKGLDEWCYAQHAETNALINAARTGVVTLGCSLYMNSVIPCSNCFGRLINAGITEIVIEQQTLYDKQTAWLIEQRPDILIREFKL
jgi:dCMP deaminase